MNRKKKKLIKYEIIAKKKKNKSQTIQGNSSKP